MRESELAPPVRAHLEALGYTVWVDPDGSDYLDLVARRGGEVGLVELKVADWKKVVAQALRRRGWGDWVAVALPSPGLARKAVERPATPRGRRVGVWLVRDGRVEVLRPAEPLVAPGESPPFPEMRAALLELTDRLLAGELPEGVGWGLAGAARTADGRLRTTRDWRLPEFEDPGEPGDAPD